MTVTSTPHPSHASRPIPRVPRVPPHPTASHAGRSGEPSFGRFSDKNERIHQLKTPKDREYVVLRGSRQAHRLLNRWKLPERMKASSEGDMCLVIRLTRPLLTVAARRPTKTGIRYLIRYCTYLRRYAASHASHGSHGVPPRPTASHGVPRRPTASPRWPSCPPRVACDEKSPTDGQTVGTRQRAARAAATCAQHIAVGSRAGHGMSVGWTLIFGARFMGR